MARFTLPKVIKFNAKEKTPAEMEKLLRACCYDTEVEF
jgi:hypothetical protein